MEFELSRVVDALPGLVWTALPDGQIDFLNERWCQYTGLIPREAFGLGWQTAIHPEDWPRLLAQWRSMVASGQPGEMEARLRRFDGIYRWFRFRLSPLAEDAGKVTKWCGIGSDIEDHMQTEPVTEAIRANERHLRQIVDSIPGLVCTMSPTGEIDKLNKQLLEYFGKTPAELKSWAMTDAVHLDDLPRVVAAYTHAVTTGTPYDIEHRCRRADGVYRWFQIRALPLRDVGGCITGWHVLLTDIEDRKRAEDALRASERSLDQIINTIPTTVWSTLPDGFCDFLNQRWLDYTGLTEDQALGWGWMVVIHPDDSEEIVKYWKSCLATGRLVDTEVRMRRCDGTYRWFLLRGAPLRDESGNIRRWYGTNLDIEDRKQAEEKLRRSEAFLAEGQRLSSTGSFSWRVDLGEVTFSEEACRIFEFEPGAPVTLEQIGRRVHPDDVSVLYENREEARNGGSDQDYQIRLRMPDGSIKYLHTISHGTRDREGRLECIGAIQDVTARHLAEEQLRKSELHLRQMTETIPEMLWSAAAEGAIDYCNGRLLEYTGFPAHEVMGAGWTKLLHPDDVEHTAQVWRSCVDAGTSYVVEARILHAADCSYRWCLMSALPLLDRQGRILKWYGTVVDTHDRKQSEAKLREIQEELAHVTRVTTMGELAASIAHEINQPIAGVVINGNACLRWLSRGPDDSGNLQEARETIQRIIRDGNRAGEIIGRIRTFFKKTGLAKESLDLNEAIREIIVLARNEIDKQRVVLRLELSDALPYVRGDRVQLQQVMLNLILNAVDAMANVEGRTRDLLIQTQSIEEREVVVTVRDAGTGLSPESIDQVFKAFHTTKSGGLGMGLSISRSIVENHSGRLWVTRHEGPGASFCFTLPSHPSQSGPEVEP